MEDAPDNERPGGAVPDAGDHHGEKHIAVGGKRAVAVAAQREINVVLEPGGQADVPARPEVA